MIKNKLELFKLLILLLKLEDSSFLVPNGFIPDAKIGRICTEGDVSAARQASRATLTAIESYRISFLNTAISERTFTPIFV